MTSLSFIGKSTLFSRVAVSPQPEIKKNMPKTVAQDPIKDLNGTSLMASNNQSTTLNNTTNLSKTMRTSNSTFRDTVQRGVLSGIGILKK